MRQELEATIAAVCKDLFNIRVDAELTRPAEQFGDYSTNAALQLAKQLGKNPREVAEQLVNALRKKLAKQISKISLAGPGFINIRLSDAALWEAAESQPAKVWQGKTVVAEYSDPNIFKELHAGHLYTSLIGHTIGTLYETVGATVHRVNFGSDVGLPVAKAMWGIIKFLGGEHAEKLSGVKRAEFSGWISARYVEGHNAYEDDEAAKAEVVAYNKRIYEIHAQNDHASAFAQIYWTVRQWSYDYLNDFYARIGTPFEKYYPESLTSPIGLKTVEEQMRHGVFEKSDGAIVFKGETYGLHTRVFINSNGLPTYEAKDVGLIIAKWQDYRFDESVIITGNDITEYMKVVLKAVEQFQPKPAERTRHITHGQVKLAGGVKMSSRKGNVLRAVDVLEAASKAAANSNDQNNEETALAAVRYAFLKSRIGGDIIYDPKEAVAIEGNSGPYIQYAHARARSVLAKSKKQPFDYAQDKQAKSKDLELGERKLLRKVGEYAEVVDRAVQEVMPHHICTYLFELAQVFNSFYEHNRVIGDERESVRLELVNAYADTLKKGLALLGISAPEKM